ncbi:MAG: hypothetical protein IT160_07100 [Bryobacterales bacterium]|nr:hypothetical protein [Bryobacterales bacterium]
MNLLATETNNYVPDVRRAQFTPLYDTFKVAATENVPSKIVMFGSTAGAAGIELTNMTRAFELPHPMKHTVKAVRVVPIGCDAGDVTKLQQNYVLRLIRGNAVELEAPLEYWASGAGTNGIADPNAIASLGEYPIELEHGDHFEVNIIGTSFAAHATTPIFVRVYLDGLLEKGVQ